VKTPTPILACDLPEYLDSAAVSALRGHVALHPSAHTLMLYAQQVCRFDPVGVLRLWEFCNEQFTRGVRVRVIDLHPSLSHRLKAHPLLDFAAGDDSMFHDPFGSFQESQR
jgi:hypothetical protein